jgi:hypothetical protein
MAVTQTIVFIHLKDGPAPAGRLVMTEEPRNAYATFAPGAQHQFAGAGSLSLTRSGRTTSVQSRRNCGPWDYYRGLRS